MLDRLNIHLIPFQGIRVKNRHTDLSVSTLNQSSDDNTDSTCNGGGEASQLRSTVTASLRGLRSATG